MSLCRPMPRPKPATPARAASSLITTLKRKSSTPPPPYSSGTAMPRKPLAPAATRCSATLRRMSAPREPLDRKRARGPLAGLRVLEFAGLGPLPHAGMVLADLGALVLRVERPGAVPPAPRGPVDRGRAHVLL